MTARRPKNDLSFVLRVADLLEEARLRVWVFGGWAEELQGLRAPCEHTDIDLLYPGRDFERVDRFMVRAAIDEVIDKHRPHKRAFQIEGVLVELLLVQRGEGGWFTDLPGGRHHWPADIFTAAGRLPVASEAALVGYRAVQASSAATRAA